MNNINGFDMIISGLLTNLLPFENSFIKMQIGLILTQIINIFKPWFSKSVESNNIYKNIYKKFGFVNNTVIIKEKYLNESNPIYDGLENYLINNNEYITKLDNCQLIPKNGDLELSINPESNTQLYTNWTDYNKIKYPIKIELIHTNNNDNNMIKITSKIASKETITKMVQFKCKQMNKTKSQLLKIYRIHTTNEKYSNPRWEKIFVKTNKKISNTVICEKIQNTLLDDIDIFLGKESWYSEKGIPYKRGYILHGPPGTGKTSIIKSIACKYRMPIFSIDLSILTSNSELLKLVTDINYLVRNENYILTFEDIDRTELVKSFNNPFKKTTISLDCILNVLDGIIETNGRLCFITANQIDLFKNIEALMRPGRIDKSILIDYCDRQQIIDIIKQYYPIDVVDKNIDNLFTFKKMTPANLIENILCNLNNINNLIDILKQTNICTTSENISLNFKNIKKKETLLENNIKQIKKQITSKNKCIKKITKQIKNLNVKEKNESLQLQRRDRLLLKLKKLEKDNIFYCKTYTYNNLPCRKRVQNKNDKCHIHK